ncbi:MAG: hypothetical protein ACRD0A_17725 [Acidimicrobiales bacterium]
MDETLRLGTSRPNIRNMTGTIYERTFARIIGIVQSGRPTNRVRVVVRYGTVWTAFPY